MKDLHHNWRFVFIRLGKNYLSTSYPTVFSLYNIPTPFWIPHSTVSQLLLRGCSQRYGFCAVERYVVRI
jgi:hypothetical protein